MRNFIVFCIVIHLAAAIGCAKADPYDKEIDTQIDRLTNGPAAEHYDAADKLGDMGELASRAVPALIRSIEREPTTVRRHIYRALGKIHDPRAFEPLLKALPIERQLADRITFMPLAEALRDFGDVRAVRPLLQCMVGNGEEINASSAGAILSIGEPVIPACIEAAHDADPFIRLQALVVLRMMYSKLKDLRVEKVLSDALSDKSVDVRRIALLVAPVDVELKALATETDNSLLIAIVQHLGYARDQRARVPLETLLKTHNDADLHRNILIALENLKRADNVARANNGDSAALESLVHETKSVVEGDRNSAVQALSEVTRSEACQLLTDFMKTKLDAWTLWAIIKRLGVCDNRSELDVKLAILDGTAATGTGYVAEAVRNLSADDVPRLQENIIWRMEKERDPRVTPAIARHLNDPWLMQAATLLLAKRKDPAAIGPLIDALPHYPPQTAGPPNRTPDEIANALRQLTGRNFQLVKPAWEAWWAIQPKNSANQQS